MPFSFPCHRPFLPPHRQRLSWPPVTQKQARLPRQPAVVRTKWRTFIFRCISFKTISIGLRKGNTRARAAVVLGGAALTASRHHRAQTCKQHSHLSGLSAYKEIKRSRATLPGLALSSLRFDPAVEEPKPHHCARPDETLQLVLTCTLDLKMTISTAVL